MECKASLHPDYLHQMRCNVSNFNFITDLEVRACDLLIPEHLELMSSICPNLKRLDLSEDYNCLKMLKGLRSISSCCLSLQGIRLSGIQVTEVENQLQLWEILSDMKLTHLVIEPCNIIPLEDRDYDNLIKLYQKCLQLQALTLESSFLVRQCPNCDKLNDALVLSKFPSLSFCKCFQTDSIPTLIQDILTNCKEITCFCFDLFKLMSIPLVFPSELTTYNLQQLLLTMQSYDIPDTFLSAVSVHGRLVHVILMANSVSYEGITAVIANSPELLTFHVSVSIDCFTPSTKADLKKRFSKSKLFNSGGFEVIKYQHLFYFDGFMNGIVTDVTSSLFGNYYERFIG